MFSYLKKTPWKIVRKPVEGVHRFKNVSRALCNDTIKDGQNDKKSNPPKKIYGIGNIFKKSMKKKEKIKAAAGPDTKDSITKSQVFFTS